MIGGVAVGPVDEGEEATEVGNVVDSTLSIQLGICIGAASERGEETLVLLKAKLRGSKEFVWGYKGLTSSHGVEKGYALNGDASPDEA